MGPWRQIDFYSPNRPQSGVLDYFNYKGLIPEKGAKKLAFRLLQKAYQDKSIVKPERARTNLRTDNSKKCWRRVGKSRLPELFFFYDS